MAMKESNAFARTKERIKNTNEVVLGYTEQMASRSVRYLQCKYLCVEDALGPWTYQVYQALRKKTIKAIDTIKKTNSLPAVCEGMSQKPSVKMCIWAGVDSLAIGKLEDMWRTGISGQGASQAKAK